MQTYSQKLILLLLIKVAISSVPTLGAQTPKNPIKKSPLREKINRLPMQDFLACQKQALSEAKKKSESLQVRYFKAAVKVCKDQFPAYPAFKRCKKDILKAAPKNKNRLRYGLKKCREDYLSLIFDPENPLTVKIKSGQLYFAGIGLNLPVQITPQIQDDKSTPSKRMGNFDCKRLEDSLTDNSKLEYILFGNAIRSFTNMSKLPDSLLLDYFRGQNKDGNGNSVGAAKSIDEPGSDELESDELESDEPESDELGDDQLGSEDIEKAKPKDSSEPPVLVDDEWGQIAMNPKYEELSNFFPTTYCQFDRELGGLFEDIKIYYLISRAKKLALPYFGVAFYPEKAQVSAAALIQQTKEALGDGFKEQMSERGLTFIANSSFLKFDADGEPFDLCREPRRHYRIATVAKYPNSPHAAYLLLSNVHNLCTYGDRLAGFLSRALSKPSNEPVVQDKK